MPHTEKKAEELLSKANSLPLCPGVYIMKDRQGRIIYVGKSRKLKNRVSQYFQNSKKNYKTSKMVYNAEDFEYIVCDTEIEALTLENALIKQHSPKYNIKLKDAKSYPYIMVTDEQYPKIVFTRNRASGKGKYFGPFSGTATVYAVLDILHKSLGIPTCKREFPRDIGKGRPCLYYQMGQCCGVCTGKISCDEYGALIRCATDILRGNTSEAVKSLTSQMLEFAENEQFEAAAKCRDTIEALERLHQKQHVVSSPEKEMDVFGLWQDNYYACISCIYVRNGVVSDKADYTFGADTEVDESALCAFLVEHYDMRDTVPREIIISFKLEADDKNMLEAYFENKVGKKITVRQPERGDTKKLCDTVVANAEQKALQSKREAQHDENVLTELAHLLELESIPERIEAYDISNIGSENIKAGMVVYKNGRPCKQDYRIFNIGSVVGTDDYGSMREALTRRIKHLLSDKSGSYAEYPDLILIDGGKAHVSVVRDVLKQNNVDLPVFGMVKDDYHKTRALCTDTSEINIAKNRAIFTLIYKIQDEVHRFTVGKTVNAKRSTLKHSSLENIHGIGPAKAKKLLQYFGTLSALKEANEEDISKVSGVTQTDAHSIYLYFNGDGKRK